MKPNFDFKKVTQIASNLYLYSCVFVYVCRWSIMAAPHVERRDYFARNIFCVLEASCVVCLGIKISVDMKRRGYCYFATNGFMFMHFE